MKNEMKYRLPAEWEPQSGVQLTWPHRDTDWAPMLDEVLTVYRQMAREISLRERLLIVVGNTSEDGEDNASNTQPNRISSIGKSSINSVSCPTNDTWARDHGFITLIDDSQCGCASPTLDYQSDNQKSINRQLLDFCFNGWGEKFPAELDNAINRRLYDVGAVSGMYVDHLDFVLEGGSIESDGKGTIFTTSQCLMAPHRNQPLTRNEIEQRMKEHLCAERILWIDHGSLAGDDTDGHIDTLVRICPNDTLLYIKCNDSSDEHYAELQLMEEQLRTFRTIDGQPYRLLPLPLPHPIYDAEANSSFSTLHTSLSERLPATYANFLVINGAVLVPIYAQSDLDAEAMRIIGEAFPGRDIVGIDCRALIRQHGSLHCCTMQFPEGVLV